MMIYDITIIALENKTLLGKAKLHLVTSLEYKTKGLSNFILELSLTLNLLLLLKLILTKVIHQPIYTRGIQRPIYMMYVLDVTVFVKYF